MQAAGPPLLWAGTLQKQSGKEGGRWEEIEAELTGGRGLTWSPPRARKSTRQKMLKPEELISAAPWSELGSGVEHAFEIVSTAKGGKVYRFAARSDAECDALVDAIMRLVGSSAVESASNPLSTVDDSRQCAVCLTVQPAMQPWPNPDCEHEFCTDCMPQLLSGTGQRLDITCPQCRRPALRDDGAAFRIDSNPVRDAESRPPGMWPVMWPVTVRDGPEPRASEQLGELRPGDWVHVFEEQAVAGHRRVRIGDGMWVSRLSKQGRVQINAPGTRMTVENRQGLAVSSACCVGSALLFIGFDWVLGEDPDDVYESGHLYTALVPCTILCGAVAAVYCLSEVFVMFRRPRRSSAVDGFTWSYPLQYLKDEWLQVAVAAWVVPCAWYLWPSFGRR